MRKRSQPRFILTGIGILVLILCLWVILHGPREESSSTVNLIPQATRDNGAPDSGSVRNRDAERAQLGLERSRAAVPDESVPNQDRPPQSNGLEKRRAVHSTLAGVVANSQDGAPIQYAHVTLYSLGSGEEQLESVNGHDGSFRLTIYSAGRYRLVAQADGFQPYFIDRLSITPTQGNLQKTS